MKTIITTLLLGCISFANAQVIIGDAVGTATNKTSVLLEFAANQNKGIILPYVRVMPTGAALTEGTILMDVSVPAAAAVKYYAGTVKGWLNLTGENGAVNTILPSLATQQPAGATEMSTAKAVIGDVAGAPDGVLVLNSTSKAMVLPMVEKVGDVPQPAAGMMVYVKGVSPTFNKRLAVFNGVKWSFWKP